MDKDKEFVSMETDKGEVKVSKSWIDKLRDKNVDDLAKEGMYATVYSLSTIYGAFTGLYAISTFVLPDYSPVESIVALGLTGVCYYAAKQSEKDYTKTYINRKVKEFMKNND